jgi:hypothetical protein
MTEEQEQILCNLDRLRHLIHNVQKKEQYTIANSYIEYYNEVLERQYIKDVLLNNNRFDHQPINKK